MATMKVCFGFMLQDYATRCPGRYCTWVGFCHAAGEVLGTLSFGGYVSQRLFESQDDGTRQDKPAADPLMPRERFAENNGSEENGEKDT